MPQPCRVCHHPELERISQDRAEGRSLRFLSRKYGLTKSAIHRHAHHSPIDLRFQRAILELTGQPVPVRGNPEKTKPYRWKPGQSGNSRGRPPDRIASLSTLDLLRDVFRI
jgi:hypothetical protein